MRIETEGYLANGLPVLVKATYVPGYRGDRIDPPEPAGFEDIDIFWLGKARDKKLYRCNRKLTERDHDMLHEQLMDAM